MEAHRRLEIAMGDNFIIKKEMIEVKEMQAKQA